METKECIMTRRSVRRFTDQKISDEVMMELLETVRWAPSWANTQCWEIVLVAENAGKQRLAELLSVNNPSTQGILEAPVLVVFCGKKGKAGFKKGEPTTNKGDWYMFDVGIAAQNFCLAAHDMGLGTVHVGHIKHAEIDEFLGLPAGVEALEIVPVGYPAQLSIAPARKELKDFVYKEKYGNK